MTCYFFINKLVCKENILDDIKITIKIKENVIMCRIYKL